MKAVIDQYDLGTFMHLNIDVEFLNQNQVDTILIPCHAPESYMCDGEITAKQAERNWKQQLINSGLESDVVRKAMKLVK